MLGGRGFGNQLACAAQSGPHAETRRQRRGKKKTSGHVRSSSRRDSRRFRLTGAMPIQTLIITVKRAEARQKSGQLESRDSYGGCRKISHSERSEESRVRAGTSAVARRLLHCASESTFWPTLQKFSCRKRGRNSLSRCPRGRDELQAPTAMVPPPVGGDAGGQLHAIGRPLLGIPNESMSVGGIPRPSRHEIIGLVSASIAVQVRFRGLVCSCRQYT